MKREIPAGGRVTVKRVIGLVSISISLKTKRPGLKEEATMKSTSKIP